MLPQLTNVFWSQCISLLLSARRATAGSVLHDSSQWGSGTWDFCMQSMYFRSLSYLLGRSVVCFRWGGGGVLCAQVLILCDSEDDVRYQGSNLCWPCARQTCCTSWSLHAFIYFLSDVFLFLLWKLCWFASEIWKNFFILGRRSWEG